VALIVVLLIVVIASVLGIGGTQIALQAERSARNDRDLQIAWQAAEAALQDAELDIHGNGQDKRNRNSLLGELQNTSKFVAGCGNTGDSIGLCELVSTGAPAWMTVDFTATGDGARTTGFGSYTGRRFAAGGKGVEPFQAPRYVIEPIVDPGNRDQSTVRYLYRVTAMGFGPRQDIQAVAQIIYRN
jgi:type IV pilus assembly protein PilX